jgi:hypothetical protein
MRLKPNGDEMHPSVAFNFNVRRYIMLMVPASITAAMAAPNVDRSSA